MGQDWDRRRNRGSVGGRRWLEERAGVGTEGPGPWGRADGRPLACPLSVLGPEGSSDLHRGGRQVQAASEKLCL